VLATLAGQPQAAGTVRAVVLTGPAEVASVTDVDLDPPGLEEALVRIAAAGGWGRWMGRRMVSSLRTSRTVSQDIEDRLGTC
jgi:hypothetical protein